MLLSDEQKGNSKEGDRQVLYTIPRSICSTSWGRQCHKDCVSHKDIDSAPRHRGCVDGRCGCGPAASTPNRIPTDVQAPG